MKTMSRQPVHSGSCAPGGRRGGGVSVSPRVDRGGRVRIHRRGRWVGRVASKEVSTETRGNELSSSSSSSADANSGSRQALSNGLRGIREQAERDEQLSILMGNMRGQNLSKADFADEGVEMKLVESEQQGQSELPLTYNPKAISNYWSSRPVSIVTRLVQIGTVASGFLANLLGDLVSDAVTENFSLNKSGTSLSSEKKRKAAMEARGIARAAQLRQVLTGLGPAYIKLGQALSIRPDLLSPGAMAELQKLCDKVPSYDSDVARAVICRELGCNDVSDIFESMSPEPVAAASLGQVYTARLKSAGGTKVAVKVQRPAVLETVTIDLFIVRLFGEILGNLFPQTRKRVDIVALLDEWASRFFEELDYEKEAEHTNRFAASIAEELPQVVVPSTFPTYTSRRVLTTEWIEGEKLAQSTESDVGDLVNLGVICYLKQLLDTGFFHADPHPGNMIRTPDGRLAILDFGLMTEIDNKIKYGMVEAISHLIHRDYEAIVLDFVTLEFIPKGTELTPILPVLARVFDQALEGGGAKNINFQELAGDLAQITFDYPFRIPPYFALIIRAIGVLEGIALVGDPDFAIVDEAYPYLSKMLLTDPSPRLRAALQYTIYGKEGVFDVERMVDILQNFETFKVNSQSSSGDQKGPILNSSTPSGSAMDLLVSEEGHFFRDFLVDEVVKSIDALTRQQAFLLADVLGLRNAFIPVLIPGAMQPLMPLAPRVTDEDRRIISNMTKVLSFLMGGRVSGGGSGENSDGDATQPDQPVLPLPLPLPDIFSMAMAARTANPNAVRDVMSYAPTVAGEVVPKIAYKLANRVASRLIREVFVGATPM